MLCISDALEPDWNPLSKSAGLLPVSSSGSKASCWPVEEESCWTFAWHLFTTTYIIVQISCSLCFLLVHHLFHTGNLWHGCDVWSYRAGHDQWSRLQEISRHMEAPFLIISPFFPSLQMFPDVSSALSEWKYPSRGETSGRKAVATAMIWSCQAGSHCRPNLVRQSYTELLLKSLKYT